MCFYPFALRSPFLFCLLTVALHLSGCAAGPKAEQFDFSGQKPKASLKSPDQYWPLSEGDRESLKKFAARDPKNALVNSDIYTVATPADIVTLINGRSLKDFSIKGRVRQRSSGGPGLPGLPGALLAASALSAPASYAYYEQKPLPTALSFTSYPEVVDILVSAGCDPREALSGWPGRAEVEPAVMAALLKYSPVVEPGFAIDWAGSPYLFEPESFRLFLRYSGTVNERNSKGETPLLAAAWFSNRLCADTFQEKKFPYVRMLVEEGADVNASDDEGRTPLYNAIKTGNFETARFLIASGANGGSQAHNNDYSLLYVAVSEGLCIFSDAKGYVIERDRAVQEKKIPAALGVIRFLAERVPPDSAEAAEAYALAANDRYGEAIASVLKKAWGRPK